MAQGEELDVAPSRAAGLDQRDIDDQADDREQER